MNERNWFGSEPLLQRLLERQLGSSYARARPRLERMGRLAANEVATWAQLADQRGPRLVTHDRHGLRIDEIEYHPSYRWMQQVAYGEGIIAATYSPALAPERGNRGKALTFGLGYLFAQAEEGLYCPVCMTDGAARLTVKFGSPALQERFVPRLASQSLTDLYTGAMFLTEREGGSDVGQLRTVARGSGDVVKLYGEKWFCSNVDADVIMILARPEGAGEGTKGLGLYLLPRTLENGRRNAFRIDRIKDKLGVRSMPTGEVTLDGAEAYRLGGAGEGFRQMAEMLNLSRLYNAVASVSVMRRSLTEALEWAQSRTTFHRKLVQHPLMAETLLDLAAEQRGALVWVFRLIELLDKADLGEATALETKLLRLGTPLAKAYSAKRAVWCASEALEVLGGNGYIEDWPMARVFRDAQVLPIWEGSTNVLALDAFRAIKRENAHEALFSEFETLVSQAGAEWRSRLGGLVDELAAALKSLDARGAESEHLFRAWTERASLLWEVLLLLANREGEGALADARAARRLLARHAPRQLLEDDVARPEDVEAVAFQ